MELTTRVDSSSHMTAGGDPLPLKGMVPRPGIPPMAIHLVCTLGLTACSLLPATLRAAEPIRHRFLAADESRSQLIYVDQFDPSKDWTLKTPEKHRDMQLIGGGKLLVNTDSGYREYDLQTHQETKHFKLELLRGSNSVQRLADGRTIVGCNQDNGITFHVLDAADQPVTTCAFPQINSLRLFRLSPRGTLLFGAMDGNDSKAIEANLKGEILRSVTLTEARHIYQVLEKPNKQLLATDGYGAAIEELDAANKMVRKLGGKPGPPGLLMYFFAGMQVLKNGNIMVCNWTGHGARDSEKAPQLLEFDSDGKIVWQWHDPQRAGSLHGVIVLDDLDTNALNTDSSSVLGAAKK